MNANRLLSAALACFAVLTSAPSRALDTDVYLKPKTVDRDDSPLVMLILDNSSSMSGYHVKTPVAYDPNTTYTGAFDVTKIYWKDDSTQSAAPATPSTYSNQYFPAANNHCKQGDIPWYGDTTRKGTTGYVSLKAAMHQGANNSQWGTLLKEKNTAGTVDCEPDHKAGQANTNVDATYKWLAKNGKGYTDSTNEQQRYSNWGNTVTLYSGNYLNYLNGTQTYVYEPRMVVARRAVKTLVDANPGVQFGLMLFNKNLSTPHGGYVAMRIGKLTEVVQADDTSTTTVDETRTRAEKIKEIVDAISHRAYPSSTSPTNDTDLLTCNDTTVHADVTCGSGDIYGTPLAETMWEAKLYLSGEAPKYGTGITPTPAVDSAAISGGKYVSPFAYECQQAYVIYLTDGNPWQTDDTNADSLISGLTNIGSFNAKYSNNESSKLDELARWMYNNDLSTKNGNQRAITYTIAFALDATNSDDVAGSQLLLETAQNGGGKRYEAEDATALAEALQNALIEIQQTNTSFAAPSLSVNAFNKLFNRDEVYFALFKPSTTTRWDGNVKKFKLCAQTTCGSGTDEAKFGEVIDYNNKLAIDKANQRIKDSALSYWSSSADGGDVKKGGAGGEIGAGRNLYTYLGAYTTGTGALPSTGIRVNTTSGTGTFFDTATKDPTLLGLTDSDSDATTAATADTTPVTNLINWMNGSDSYNEDGNTSTTTRWAHGDPLHSRPAAITFGKDSTTAKNPIIKLIYATNDGVIHIVNDYDGAEEWAFIPKEMLPHQYNLAQDAEGAHIYGVDGTPTFWIKDVDNNGIIEPGQGDHVYMYIGMRRTDAVNPDVTPKTPISGNIYAFDLTPSSTLDDQTDTLSPKLMFVIQGGTGNYLKLAQTWSRPAVANIRFGCSGNCTTSTDENDAKTVLIFGGGYDSSEDNSIPVTPKTTAGDKVGNAIYIADAATGERLWWASDVAPTSAPTDTPTLTLKHMRFSVAADLALMDSNGDGEVDRIYASDTGGQIHRIDLGQTLKKNTNGGTVGYVFADVGCKGSARDLADPANDCVATVTTDRRKFFYPPDVAQVVDTQYEDVAQSKYDVVTIVSGDREDPIDILTGTGTPVNNRIYAFRDYNINSLAGSDTADLPSRLTDSDLYDTTANDFQEHTSDEAEYQAALTALKGKSGWYIELKESTTPTWVGEKGLAKTVIFNNVLYATTYVPANNSTAQTTCAASEGLGRLYGLNLYNGVAAVDFDKSGTVDSDDRTFVLGGGIPSELVTVIREGGTSALVGTSGGATQPPIDSALPRFKTFWYEK